MKTISPLIKYKFQTKYLDLLLKQIFKLIVGKYIMRKITNVLLISLFVFQLSLCSNLIKERLRNSSNSKTLGVSLKKCSIGQKLFPNPNHKPTSNGCGPEGSTRIVTIGKVIAPHFQSCCDKHDICYGTCNPTNKNTCDQDFYDCMKEICDEKFSSIIKKPLKVGCKLEGKVLFTAVSKLGENAYNIAQNDACICQ
jgi:secretory phospholipase A2